MSTATVPAQINPKPTLVRRFFDSKDLIHPIWRLVLFAALVWLLEERVARQLVRFVVLNLLPRGSMMISPAGEIGPWHDILQHGFRFLAVIGASWGMAKFERRSIETYGLPLRAPSMRHFLLGSLVAVASVAALLGSMFLFHAFEFGSLATTGTAALQPSLLWILGCLAVAFHEEFFFRGYVLVTGAEAFRFWPAATLLSAWFAFAHTGNPGENIAGLLSVFIFGLLFCFMVRKTGTLWLAVGFHSGWNLAETFIFGVPDSGVISRGRLLAPVFHGPAWLTGGSAGPEGSALSFALVALLALLIYKTDLHNTPAQLKSRNT